MPDLFSGDAIDPTQLEAGLNLTSWLALHSPEKIDGIIKSTVGYVRNDLGIKRVGAVGYCFGGKYVPRWLKGEEGGVDVGFIAHPSNLNEEEIAGVRRSLGIAAGSKFCPHCSHTFRDIGSLRMVWEKSLADGLFLALDASFNSTAKAKAESILTRNNVTFQSNLYAGAPHGFGVRVNQSIPQQAYAKQ
jgi:dienelactone hydrolase